VRDLGRSQPGSGIPDLKTPANRDKTFKHP
jgi:hypothetical protein